MSRSLDPRQHLADRLIAPIRDGKPELGWRGDPNLMLVFARLEQRWELWEHNPSSGADVMILAGPPGAEINEDAINLLIMRLVEGDTHRSGNSAEAIVDRVLAANDKLSQENEAKAVDMAMEPMARFFTEAAKVYGSPKTRFGYGD